MNLRQRAHEKKIQNTKKKNTLQVTFLCEEPKQERNRPVPNTKKEERIGYREQELETGWGGRVPQ